MDSLLANLNFKAHRRVLVLNAPEEAAQLVASLGRFVRCRLSPYAFTHALRKHMVIPGSGLNHDEIARDVGAF